MPPADPLSPEALTSKICRRAFASPAASSSSSVLCSCARSSEVGCKARASAGAACAAHDPVARCAFPEHLTEHAVVVCLQAGEGLTSLRFSDSGMQCAVGTQNGLVALYDLRSPRPSIVKDHNYGAPIKDIKFLTSGSIAGGQ